MLIYRLKKHICRDTSLMFVSFFMKKIIYAFNPRKRDPKTGMPMVKFHRGYAEPATAETVLNMLSSDELQQLVCRIRSGEEQLKEQLPSICPHYSQFRNNHRAQADIIPEAFTYKTCVDVDDKELVDTAIKRAQEVNSDPFSDWEGMVEYIEYSARKKVHIWIRIPRGMTIKEAQVAFCQEIGVPFDESCITPERFIYMTGDMVYRSENWLKPVSDVDVLYYKEEYLLRGLDVDGRPLVATTISTSIPSFIQEETFSPATLGIKVTEADGRTRFIMQECMKKSGLNQKDFIIEGGRHNAVKSILSVGAAQLLTKGEFYGVLQELMPEHWHDKNITQLVNDFYTKYTEPCQRFTRFQQHVFSDSMKMVLMEEDSIQEEPQKEENPCIYGDMATLESIYRSSTPPLLPKKLPSLVKLVTSKTPLKMKATVAQAMFPALGTYPKGLSFEYIDGQERELRINCLVIGKTGSGKDTCLNQPLKHITSIMMARDAENRKKLNKWKEDYNATSVNKSKPERPKNTAIQNISGDVTQARLAELLDDAKGAFLYTHLHEFEQWYQIEGKEGKNCTFKNLKLADDENNIYGQERVGTTSITYQGPLNLNWNACTTLSRVQKMLQYVMVDGPVSRLCLATTPDTGLGAPIPKYGKYDQGYDEKLKPYIENLITSTGKQSCKQACKLITKLKKECDEFTEEAQDEVFDNLTHRALVHTFRKACLLYAANGFKWEKSMEGFCRWSLHYDLWLKMHFLGDLIKNANCQTKTSRRGPCSKLLLLPNEFTCQDAINILTKEGQSTKQIKNLLSKWEGRNKILKITDESYRKVEKN